MKDKLLQLFGKYLESAENEAPEDKYMNQAELIISERMEFEEFRWAELLYAIVNLMEFYLKIRKRCPAQSEGVKEILFDHIEELLDIEE